MEYRRRFITLQDDTFAYLYRDTSSANAAVFKRKVTNYVKTISGIVETEDYSKLSDVSFYKLVTKMLEVELEPNDYLKILSLAHKKKFTSFDTINTKMVRTCMKTEGHGRSFDYYDADYKISLYVASTDDFEASYSKLYTREEIDKLIAEGKILVLEELENELTKGYLNFTKEEWKDYKPVNLEMDGWIPQNEYFPYAVKLLRKKFKRKLLVSEAREYLYELVEEINEVINSNTNDFEIQSIASKCKNWFEDSKNEATLKRINTKIDIEKSLK